MGRLPGAPGAPTVNVFPSIVAIVPNCEPIVKSDGASLAWSIQLPFTNPNTKTTPPVFKPPFEFATTSVCLEL